MADSFDRFVKGVIFGGIIGAAIALLYAPKSGRELREDIKKKSDDIKESADKGMADARTVAAHLMDEAMKKADALSKQAEHLIHDAQEKAAELLRDLDPAAKQSTADAAPPSSAGAKKKRTRASSKHDDSEQPPSSRS